MYGGGIGGDLQFGRIVGGIEGFAYGSTVDARDDTLGARVGLGRDFEVSGRLGYVLAPRWLAYAKGGYTNTTVTGSVTFGGSTIRVSQDYDGFRVGGGVEHRIGRNLFVKGEYRYSQYGIEGTDLDRHQVIGGVGFRF